jgi:hypothetical protein
MRLSLERTHPADMSLVTPDDLDDGGLAGVDMIQVWL